MKGNKEQEMQRDELTKWYKGTIMCNAVQITGFGNKSFEHEWAAQRNTSIIFIEVLES